MQSGWPGWPRVSPARPAAALSRAAGSIRVPYLVPGRPLRAVMAAHLQFVLDSADNELLRSRAGPWLSPVVLVVQFRHGLVGGVRPSRVAARRLVSAAWGLGRSSVEDQTRSAGSAH